MRFETKQTVPGALLAGLAVVLGACGGDEDPVVARVGNSEIRASRLARFVERIPEGMRSQQQGQEAVRDHLESVVDQELLLAEAASRRLDESAEVRREVEARASSRLSQVYLQRRLTGVDVTAEEIELSFRDLGYDRQRLLARIVVPSREEAARLVAEIEAGTPLADVAIRYTGNDSAAAARGEMGWVGIGDLSRYRIPEHTFFSLADGRLAEAVDLGGVWQVYSFQQSREAHLADVWEELHDRLLREKWHRRLRQEYETLARRYGLEMDSEGLASLLDADGGDRISQERPLYRFAEVVVTVGDYLHDVRSRGFQDQAEDSTQVSLIAQKVVLPERLFATAARERGWHEEEEFGDYYDRERHEIVLKALATDELDRQGGISDQDVERFYEEDPSRFLRSEEVVIRRLYVHDEQTARDLRRQLEEGVAMEELLKLPEVAQHVHPRTGGRTRLFAIHRSRFPELVDAAFAANVDDLVGPVPMAEGWVVFRVLERKGGQVQPFEASRRRALGLLRQERRTAAMGQLIRRLRTERQGEIELYPERFARADGP